MQTQTHNTTIDRSIFVKDDIDRMHLKRARKAFKKAGTGTKPRTLIKYACE